MIRNKEELERIHKEKCKELKHIRAKIAKDLGIDLHQRECTYQGYCSGTCPKCMQEEMMLNAAIMKKQMEESNLKRRVAAAGLTTAAAVCLSGCNANDRYQIDGDIQYIPDEIVEEWEGGITTPETEDAECTVVELEGDVAYIPPEEWELAGEIAVYEEDE